VVPASLRFTATALFCAVLLGCNRKDPEPTPRRPPPLTQQGLASSSWKSAAPDLQDRLLIAHALARGKTEAVVMVATRMGGAPAIAADIARLGGQIQARFDEVGYLYAVLPIERLAEVSALPDVLMAHLDGGAPGGLYALDHELIGYPDTEVWGFARTHTFLSDSNVRLPAEPSDTVSQALGEMSIDLPLSLRIDGLLRVAADPMIQEIPHLRNTGRFPVGGQDLYALMANRAVEVYGKPMVAMAGDNARVDSINGAASARRVLAIAGSEYPDGTVVARSSRGPASDGGAKPDLAGVATNQRSSAASTAEMSRAVNEFISAARAENLPADARHIVWALRMGARRLEDFQAHDQGFGAIDAARATELLRQVKARRFELPDILTRAPVKTYLARFLPEPGVGQGLYEREGWLAKRTDERIITLVRQNGPPTPLAYTLQWQGNDGTFKARQEEVILPFDTPVEVEIEITPAEPGIHSALLYLIDKTTALPVHAVMTTIIASEQFTAANGYTIQHHKQALAGQRPRRHFLEVPPNVSSLRVEIAAGSGQVEMLLGTGGPAGTGFNFSGGGKSIDAGKSRVVVVPYAPPGVYELTLLPVGSSPASVDVTASIHYVDSLLDEAPPNNNSTTLWMNNIYAPLQRTSVLTQVGARRVIDDVGGPTGMRVYNITVPADSSTLRVAASPSDGRARMGVYLYDCSWGICTLWGSDAFTRTTTKLLIVPKPSPGEWRVVVDATAAGTAFTYSEIISNPRFGSGTAEGEDAPRRIGARWNQKVSFEVHEPVPFGYEAVAVMDVIDPDARAEERALFGEVRYQPLRPLPLTTQVFKLSRAN